MNAPRSVTLLALGLLGLLGSQTAAAQLSRQDEDAIRAIVKSALTSLTAGDATTYAGLFQEDAVFQPPNAPALRGRTALANWARAWRAATPAGARLAWQNVQVHGDRDIAYVTTDYVLDVGNGSPNLGKQMGVYRRDRAGRWQIAAVSYSSDLPAPGSAATSQQAAVSTFYSVWNTKEYDRLDAILTPSFRRQGADGATEGLAAWKAHMRQVHSTYPDFRIEVSESVFNGDIGVTHWTVTGTHSETGRRITIPGMSLLRFEEGRITEQIAYFDPAPLQAQ